MLFEVREKFKSLFDQPKKNQAQPQASKEVKFPPQDDLLEDEIEPFLGSGNDWDIATRYHEFKNKTADPKILEAIRDISVEAVLRRAREVMGSLVHPMSARQLPLSQLPANAEKPEFDLDSTLEEELHAVAQKAGLGPETLWYEFQSPKAHEAVLCVDTSLSMTGEKLALTAVAIAVVLLQFPHGRIGIVAFENRPQILKKPDEKPSLAELVGRFLDVPAQGYTHLEAGLKAALEMVEDHRGRAQSQRVSAVLLTDGKYTAGRDPSYLAPRFPHLVVLKMGKENASRQLCQDLAQKGHGTLKEVGELDALPQAMYGAVKEILKRS